MICPVDLSLAPCDPLLWSCAVMCHVLRCDSYLPAPPPPPPPWRREDAPDRRPAAVPTRQRLLSGPCTTHGVGAAVARGHRRIDGATAPAPRARSPPDEVPLRRLPNATNVNLSS